MIIDLAGLFGDYGGEKAVSGICNFDKTEFMGAEYSFPGGLEVSGKITKDMKALHLACRVSGKITTSCARCLKEITVPVDFELSEMMVRDSESEIAEDEDIIVISGDEICIDDIVLNNFFMDLPGKFLCSPDCRGLCPKCGKDLNLGDCGCNDEETDPRWAVLAEIMKNSKTE